MNMETNIVEILKDKPQGTKLYSSACGKCKLESVYDKSFKISFYNSKFGFMNGGEGYLDKNGKLYDDGECVVFPSKEMRDWSKFAWNTGDILVNKDGNAHVIFEGFDDDTYETFNGNNYLWKNEGTTMCFGEYEDELPTSDFSKANKEDAQKYIHQIEKRLGYKLNFETLKIEKHPEFKDGDIVVYKCEIDDVPSNIFIFRGISQRTPYYSYYASLDSDGFLSYKLGGFGIYKRELRLATEEEKEQLFSALEKKGKAWDGGKKAIVDLKPKVDELKPFDKVLVRDSESDKWRANLFGYIDKDKYYHCVYANWVYCIPYEGNEHLLGTIKDVEG